MNQVSQIGFGPDADVLAAYAHFGNDRLGNVDLTVENVGSNTLTFEVKEKVAAGVAGGTPSGYKKLGSTVTVVPKGVTTVSYNVLAKQIGFFGSGNTVANVSVSFRNKGDLRGAQVDIVQVGRRSFGFDDAFDRPTLTKKWGTAPDDSTAPTNF